MTRQLSVRDVRAVIAKVPNLSGIVLVGGQALNYWAEALGIASENSIGEYGPAVSGDIDFLGPASAAIEFGKAVNGKTKIAGIDDPHTPNSALVTLDIEGEAHLIDFLHGLKGFPPHELARLKKLAVPVGLVAGNHQPILVMHPVHCLASQLENIYGQLNRREEEGGQRYIGRIKLAIETCRRITLNYLDKDDSRSALNVAENVHTLSLSTAALRARELDRVLVANGICEAEAMPKEFLEQRLPQMRKARERKFGKFIRIRSQKSKSR